MFLIVEFTETNEVEVVPSCWMTDSSSCCWPSLRSAWRIAKLVQNQAPVTEGWKAYPVRVLHTADSFEVAGRKLKLAEEQSDLQTDVDDDSTLIQSKRRVIRPKRLLSEESDSGENCAPIGCPDISPPYGSEVGPLVSRTPQAAPAASFASSQKKQRVITLSSGPPSCPKVPLPYGQEAPVPASGSRRAAWEPESSTSSAASQKNQQRTPVAELSDFIDVRPLTPATTQTGSLHAVSGPQAMQPRTMLARLRAAAVTEYEIALLHIMERVQQQQQHNGAMLAQISQLLNMTNAPTPLPTGISFPVGTMEELRALDALLADENMVRQTVRSLSFVGGPSVDKTVRRLMSHILSNGVGKQMNWKGKGAKEPFSSLNLRHVIYGATRSNPSTSRATNAEIEEVVKKWLRFAGDRDGGRRQRDETRRHTQQDA